MPELRQAQFQALWDDHFARRVQEHLQRVLPQQCAAHSATTLIDLIGRSVAEGRRWGLAGEASLAGFASLAVRYGADFSSHPTVAAGLASVAQAPVPDRAFMGFHSRIPAEVWDELRPR